jgi:hypothetical protein
MVSRLFSPGWRAGAGVSKTKTLTANEKAQSLAGLWAGALRLRVLSALGGS